MPRFATGRTQPRSNTTFPPMMVAATMPESRVSSTSSGGADSTHRVAGLARLDACGLISRPVGLAQEHGQSR